MKLREFYVFNNPISLYKLSDIQDELAEISKVMLTRIVYYGA